MCVLPIHVSYFEHYVGLLTCPLTPSSQLRIAPELLVPQPRSSSWSAWQEPSHQLSTLAVPKKADRTIVVEISQPELNATGILR